MAGNHHAAASNKVQVTIEEGLAIVTINNPPVNSLTQEVMNEFHRAIDLLAKNEHIQAVIITGAGEKAFVAGADIKQFLSLDEQDGRQLSLDGQLVFEKMEQLPVPVICAVNGAALGGGFELALACDIRIAAENAKLGLPEVGLGLIPGYGGTQRLTRLIGLGKAKEIIFTGKPLSAQEAHQIGLVEKAVPEKNALEAAKDMAAHMMKNSPQAISKAKMALHKALETHLQDGLEIEAHLFGKAMATKDCKEGAAAFLEKRPPHFQRH
ncbi:enoyl-CoA hydratase [Alteribacillus persepolensis]|uniref:Enoyl-CoA hydratase n=1 Tax=Alteribacillus persepolensis TaxID=568899 RepID=A0A1G8GU12_9BACI|nr:enoyl-CoA hydratase-related protein [Alteribacillus persepolensis]SDH97803.1 enoyl-CoA hydratase [Alteribacillus persepolensis]